VIGIVLVSHSAQVAEGAAALAAQMAAPGVRIGAAGGMDEPGVLGTDAARVLRAVEDVWSDDGVLVLMDLGSAVLSAELAVDLLDDERRPLVALTEAPLVEGAVAAAVAAGLGEPLATCAAEARRGLQAKAAQLAGGAAPGEEATAGNESRTASGEGSEAQVRVAVTPALGLHARPAALLVRTAAGFEARVTVTDLSNGRGPVNARSLSAVATLGARHGDDLLLTASGPQADQAVEALRRLAEEGFGEGPGVDAAADAPRDGRAAAAGAGRPDVAAAAPRGATAATRSPAEPPSAGTVLTGLAASPGLAIGPAGRLCASTAAGPAQPAAEPKAEWRALERALTDTAAELRRTRDAVAARAASADAAIFDAHLLFLEDEEVIGAARSGVFRAGETAAAAWTQAVAAAATAWDAVEDPYQRARAADLRAVGEQVLTHLLGGASTNVAEGTGILVAADLSPSQVAALQGAAVDGVACAGGAPTSHAAILARALGVPAVLALGPAILAVADGVMLVVDGEAGTVAVDPDADQLAAIARRRDQAARTAAAERTAAARPAVTRDGTRIVVEANIATPLDVPAAVAAGADGVGLLRTELLFLDAPRLPDEDEQTDAYDRAAVALGGRPLTVRTLDAGADKPLPYLAQTPEANPFLGLRGLRLGLARPELLLTQLRAVLRTAAHHPVRVMFPMVSTVEEVRDALELLGRARASLLAEGIEARTPEVGVMVEVPSAALTADALAPLVDFFSIGTNDLTQYTLAAERGNPGLAGLCDALHPAVLRLIARTVDAAGRAGRRVGVCGEVAADRAALPVLLGLGVRELSVAPTLIPGVKRAVRDLDVGAAAGLAERALEAGSAAAVRDLLAGRDP